LYFRISISRGDRFDRADFKRAAPYHAAAPDAKAKDRVSAPLKRPERGPSAVTVRDSDGKFRQCRPWWAVPRRRDAFRTRAFGKPDNVLDDRRRDAVRSRSTIARPVAWLIVGDRVEREGTSAVDASTTAGRPASGHQRI
jgi:hypothetical protein